MSALDPDNDILELYAGRDWYAAMHKLMQRHRTAVHRYCSRQLRDITLADDVCQEIFIVAFFELPSFERRSTVRTWLFKIARHRVLAAARSRTRREARAVELAKIADVHDPRPLPFESLAKAQLLELTIARVRELPILRQNELMLRYGAGLTFEDAAVVCGDRPGTLQARLARTLRQLRVAIESR